MHLLVCAVCHLVLALCVLAILIPGWVLLGPSSHTVPFCFGCYIFLLFHSSPVVPVFVALVVFVAPLLMVLVAKILHIFGALGMVLCHLYLLVSRHPWGSNAWKKVAEIIRYFYCCFCNCSSISMFGPATKKTTSRLILLFVLLIFFWFELILFGLFIILLFFMPIIFCLALGIHHLASPVMMHHFLAIQRNCIVIWCLC